MYSTLINKWFRFSKKKCFLPIPPSANLIFYSFKKILHDISNFYIALRKAIKIREPSLLHNLDTFITPFQVNDFCIGRRPKKLSNAKYAFFGSLALYR